MKAEFIAATVAEQEYTGGPVEICAVLNRLPHGLVSGPDDQLIDEICVMQSAETVLDVLRERGSVTSGRPQPVWAQLMAGMRPKTLIVCPTCHDSIHHRSPANTLT